MRISLLRLGGRGLGLLFLCGFCASSVAGQGAGRPSKPRPPEPQEREVRLVILSQPGLCRVFLNGEFRGTTDESGRLEIRVPRGRYTVRVVREGYGDQVRVVNLLLPREEHRFILSPILLDITVSTDPAGARISLDGEYKGTTPVSGSIVIRQVPVGSHTLRVEKERYLVNEAKIEVSRARTRWHVTLSPDPFWVKLERRMARIRDVLHEGNIAVALEECVSFAPRLKGSDADALAIFGSTCREVAKAIQIRSRSLLSGIGLFGLQVEAKHAEEMSQLYQRLHRLYELLRSPDEAALALAYAQYWRAKAKQEEFGSCGPADFDPDEAEIQYDLAWCAFADRPRAERHFYRARDLKKDWALPHFGLAKLSWDEADRERDKGRRRRKFEAIIADLTRAIALGGEFTYYFHAERALAYVKIGKLMEAITDGQQAVRLRPDSAYAHYAVGFAYYQVGRREFPRAKAELEAALRLEKDKLSPDQRKLAADWLAEIQRRR